MIIKHYTLFYDRYIVDIERSPEGLTFRHQDIYQTVKGFAFRKSFIFCKSFKSLLQLIHSYLAHLLLGPRAGRVEQRPSAAA